MSNEQTKAEKICDEYEPKRQLYKELCESVAKILRGVLLVADIKTYSISFREKDTEKLREKIERRKEEGTPYEALDDVEDLAGVRIVTYLDSQKKQVANLVYREFEGSCLHVEDKYDPKGYRGTHFVLRLGEDRVKLSEYSRYKGLKCEVQVSSILYHAWSEIEHDVIYKPGANRKQLESLGLSDIEAAFQEIMAQHLEEATIQFDLLYAKHKEVLAAGAVIYSDYLSDIRGADSNDVVISILDIAGKFAHKKPEEALQMAEEAIKRASIEPQVIGEFGKQKIYGKSHADLLLKGIEVIARVRYWNVERVLSSLFALSTVDVVSKKVLESIKAVAKYDHAFLKQHKNLYPQRASLDYVKQIPEADRPKQMPAVTAVIGEILSSSVEGTEWSSEDTLTFHSGALVPNEGLKKMRQEAMDFILTLYKQTSSVKDRLALIRVLLIALHTPLNAAYGDDLIDMIREDSRRLAGVLSALLFTDGKVSSYPIAQEVEEDVIRLLRSEQFKNEEVQTLYEQLQGDADYAAYCALVGNIQEFRDLDEDWDEAGKRRSREVDSLVEQITDATLDDWYQRLNTYAIPLAEGVVEEWKYQSYRAFFIRLTETKSGLATTILNKALSDGAPLSQTTFVTPYLTALRRKNDFVSWDAFVALIREKKNTLLMASVVISLNLDEGADLSSSIRDEDIEMLGRLVKAEPPFDFTKDTDDPGFALRYSLVNTLARLFRRDNQRMELLMIEEITNHPTWAHIYFRELPFASHRKWMSLREWSPEGIASIKEQLVKLPDLDWHVQEMMLELGDDPIELILDIFKRRILRGKEDDDGRYDEVPYHFNPDLQRYLTEHPRYVDEMVKWLREMTPEWSTYNWHVSHFIQRIGGASYSTILLRLIETADTDSLKKAAHALNAFDGADFGLCFEIVKRTDDKDILGQVGAAMSGTGVISGEHGLAHAYEGKAKEVEPYITSKDKRVSAFAIAMKKAFEERARSEYERSTVGKKRRRLEFEG